MTGFIKICGLTIPEQAAEIWDMGPGALGLIFAESKRKVSPQLASAIRNAAPGAFLVGVFRSNTFDEILHLVDNLDLQAVQIYGGVTNLEFELLKERDLEIIGAVTGTESLSGAADILLIDSHEPGSGELRDLVDIPKQPWIFAGGLNPHNVAGVINKYKPWGVDVSSGIEESPGIKDLQLVSMFIENSKNAMVEINR